jgi:hypothetical protein
MDKSLDGIPQLHQEVKMVDHISLVACSGSCLRRVLDAFVDRYAVAP